MRLKRQEQATEPSNVAAPALQTARSWVTIVGGVVVALSIMVLALLRLYDGSAIALISGEFWVEAKAPTTAFGVVFPDTPQTITFSNTSGAGNVNILVSDGTQTVKSLESMALAGGPGFVSEVLDLHGLPAGSYRIDAALRDGAGGLVRYVGLYGGGWFAQVLALILGFGCGAWIVSAHVLILEVLSQRGRLRHA